MKLFSILFQQSHPCLPHETCTCACEAGWTALFPTKWWRGKTCKSYANSLGWSGSLYTEQISQSPIWGDHWVLRKVLKVHLSHVLTETNFDVLDGRGNFVRYLTHFCGLIWIAQLLTTFFFVVKKVNCRFQFFLVCIFGKEPNIFAQ